MAQHTFTIPMNYPGWQISKNGLWNGGNRRWGMNKEARAWKRTLAAQIHTYLVIMGYRHIEPPVHVEVGARFVDKGMALDLHNLSELVCDAVQEGTGIDDKHFTFSTVAPEFCNTALPEICVKVTVHTQTD